MNLENTEGAIQNGQSRETGIIGYTRRKQAKQKHNTIPYLLDTTMRKQTQMGWDNGANDL
jgi:hypothetical protein